MQFFSCFRSTATTLGARQGVGGNERLPIILTSIDRYGSLMVAEYTPVPDKKDHWHCEMLAERMKSELFEPPINMLFVDARGEVARVVFDVHGERRIVH
jgi:hypothetical protein